MNSTTALWIALASGMFALIGSLGSQVISAVSNLKAKKLELVYIRKVDLYKEFMQKAGIFSMNYNNRDKYDQFIHSYYATLLIASENVLKAFSETENIAKIAEKLQVTQIDSRDEKILNDSWSKVIHTIVEPMRDDLKRFAQH